MEGVGREGSGCLVGHIVNLVASPAMLQYISLFSLISTIYNNFVQNFLNSPVKFNANNLTN